MFRPLFLEYKSRKKKQVKRNVIKNADSDGNGCPLSWCVYMYESGCLNDSLCYIILSLHNSSSWCWCLKELVHIGYLCVIISLFITCPTSFGSIIPCIFFFFFPCHFCWLWWLTGQFEDVRLFIISEGVSGLELKSFIVDWFSRSLFFITWPLHSTSLSTLLVWVLNCSLMSTPWELFSASGCMSRALSCVFKMHHQAVNVISSVIISVKCFVL